MAAVDVALGQASVDYVVVDGGLIGLCRGHDGGSVPWDDDMDIMVMRRDFDELLRTNADALRRRGVAMTEVVAGAMYKLFFVGAPRARDRPWGFPFIDLFVFDVDPDSTMVSSYSSPSSGRQDVVPLDVLYPPRRVRMGRDSRLDLDAVVPGGSGAVEVSIPRQAGSYLDARFAGWRRWCVVSGYSHALEDWEPAGEGSWGVQGLCEDVMRLRVGGGGGTMLPPQSDADQICPSLSTQQALVPPSRQIKQQQP